MATYPSGIYSATNPSPGSPRDNPSLSGEISGLNDEVVAIETFLGTNGSLITLSVAAGDASIVVGGTTSDPTIETGTLDNIATLHPPIAAVAMNGHKITGLANGTAATDAATFGQAGWTIVNKTTNYTANPGECVLVDASAGAVTISLLSVTSDDTYRVVKTDSSTNVVTVTNPSGVILGAGLGAGAISQTLGSRGSSYEIIEDGTNGHIVGGTTGAVGLFGVGSAANGSAFAKPGPFLIQAGVEVVTFTSGGGTLTFPAPFPNGTLCVLANATNVGTSYDTVSVNGVGTGSCSLTCEINGSPAATTVSIAYMAIGF